jgi:N-acetyl sugar amidotransferase
MKYCKNCLSTNLRPNAEIRDGSCLPCYFQNNLSPKPNRIKLLELREKYRVSRIGQKNKGAYDCIVGVSGGKDSTRQAQWVRDRLGLRPLLICVAYPPKQMSEIGAKNLSNIIEMGFDLMVVTPAPKSSAILSLESFKQFGNVSKSTEMALFSTVPRIAIDLGVNTIFWGENTATQVGDNAVSGIDEFDANNLRNMNTLSGEDKWIDEALDLVYKKNHYEYPAQFFFEKKKINIFFLGPAWDDWSFKNNAAYAALHGLTLRPGEESYTGDITNASMLDEEFTNINMMLKYYKFGFGRASDYANEAIRLGKMSREDGIKLVEKYDGVCHDDIIISYCKYVGISFQEFWDIAYKYVNFNIFKLIEGNVRPVPKFKVGVDYEN